MPPSRLENDLHEKLWAVAVTTQELLVTRRLAPADFLEPVDDRTTKPLKKIRQSGILAHLTLNQSTCGPVGGEYLSAAGDLEQRHRKLFDDRP